MGLLVIGTLTGGSGELLRDELNGLVFPPADVQALAAQVARAITTPDLRARLAGQLDHVDDIDFAQLTCQRHVTPR